MLIKRCVTRGQCQAGCNQFGVRRLADGMSSRVQRQGAAAHIHVAKQQIGRGGQRSVTAGFVQQGNLSVEVVIGVIQQDMPIVQGVGLAGAHLEAHVAQSQSAGLADPGGDIAVRAGHGAAGGHRQGSIHPVGLIQVDGKRVQIHAGPDQGPLTFAADNHDRGVAESGDIQYHRRETSHVRRHRKLGAVHAKGQLAGQAYQPRQGTRTAAKDVVGAGVAFHEDMDRHTLIILDGEGATDLQERVQVNTLTILQLGHFAIGHQGEVAGDEAVPQHRAGISATVIYMDVCAIKGRGIDSQITTQLDPGVLRLAQLAAYDQGRASVAAMVADAGQAGAR